MGDIVNSKRTPSLEFDMANIDHSNGNNDVSVRRTSESAVPVPPSKKVAGDFSLRNKENSRIPTKVDNYIAMNRSLTEKSRLSLPKFEVSYERDRLQEAARADKEVDALREKLKSLDRKLHQAAQELHGLLDENEASQNMHRQLLRRKTELRDRNLAAQKQFDALEAKVNDCVAHKEQMMHLELRELELKLEDDYNEAKFQLEQQVRASVLFKDSELEQESNVLQEKKRDLESKLEEAISEKENALSQEKAAMDKELEKTLLEKRLEVENKSEAYREIHLRFEQVMKEYDSASGDAEEKNKIIDSLNSQVSDMNSKIETFQLLKLELQNTLSELNEELQTIQGTDRDWQAKEITEREKYQSSKSNYEKYMVTRRNLEHAILSYSNKARLYLRLGGENHEVVDNDKVTIKNVTYKFDKVSELTNDESYSLEWKLLVNEVLTKSDVTLIFSGSFPRESTYNLSSAFSYMSEAEPKLRESGWQISYNLQSLEIDQMLTVDLLNKCTETDIDILANHLNVISQRMRVESVSELRSVVKNANFHDKSVLHILTGDATNSKTGNTKSHRLFILNMTNLPVKRQSDVLNQSSGEILSKLLSFLGGHTRVFLSCDLETADDNTQKLLASISNFCH